VTGDFGRELQEPTDRPKGKRRSPTSWRRAPGLDGLPKSIVVLKLNSNCALINEETFLLINALA